MDLSSYMCLQGGKAAIHMEVLNGKRTLLEIAMYSKTLNYRSSYAFADGSLESQKTVLEKVSRMTPC